MHRVCKILILLFVVTALPLRGYAAVATHFCEQHQDEAAAQAGHHGGSSNHEDATPRNDPSSTSPSCSHCASCSVSASLGHEGPRMTFHCAGADRIPFADARRPGHVPEHLDRPPLVS